MKRYEYEKAMFEKDREIRNEEWKVLEAERVLGRIHNKLEIKRLDLKLYKREENEFHTHYTELEMDELKTIEQLISDHIKESREKVAILNHERSELFNKWISDPEGRDY